MEIKLNENNWKHSLIVELLSLIVELLCIFSSKSLIPTFHPPENTYHNVIKNQAYFMLLGLQLSSGMLSWLTLVRQDGTQKWSSSWTSTVSIKWAMVGSWPTHPSSQKNIIWKNMCNWINHVKFRGVCIFSNNLLSEQPVS